jgi:hypothetical protein
MGGKSKRQPKMGRSSYCGKNFTIFSWRIINGKR